VHADTDEPESPTLKSIVIKNKPKNPKNKTAPEKTQTNMWSEKKEYLSAKFIKRTD